jgi:hypothetical protein
MKEYTLVPDTETYPEFPDTTFSIHDPDGQVIVSLQVAEEDRGFLVYKIEDEKRECVDLEEDLETALDVAYSHALSHYEHFIEKPETSLADLVTGRNSVSLKDRMSERLLERILEKPEILDDIRRALEDDDIVEEWHDLSEDESSGQGYNSPHTD